MFNIYIVQLRDENNFYQYRGFFDSTTRKLKSKHATLTSVYLIIMNYLAGMSEPSQPKL